MHKRKFHILHFLTVTLLLGGLSLAQSCTAVETERLPEAEDSPSGRDSVTVKVRLSSVSTKAYSADGTLISRLDVYGFSTGKVTSQEGTSESEGDPVFHASFTEEELSGDDFSIPLSALSGERTAYLFIANLPDEIGDFLAGLTLTKVKGAFPLSAGLYLGENHDLLTGSLLIEFFNDTETFVDLYHIGYRLDIGEVVLAEGSGFLSGKSVTIEKVALINAVNTVYFIKGDWSAFGSVESVYGQKQALRDGSLGGETEGYLPGVSTTYPTRTYTITGANRPSSLSGRFIHVHNLSNARKISVTAEGALEEATLRSPSEEMSDGVMHLGYSFYGIPGRTSSAVGIYGLTSSSQNISTKLVVEATVDDTTMFYPIPIIDPQPGRIYSIGRIVLDGEGSSYVNYYPSVSSSAASSPSEPLSSKSTGSPENKSSAFMEEVSSTLWNASYK